jgi:hypothetical protein
MNNAFETQTWYFLNILHWNEANLDLPQVELDRWVTGVASAEHEASLEAKRGQRRTLRKSKARCLYEGRVTLALGLSLFCPKGKKTKALAQVLLCFRVWFVFDSYLTIRQLTKSYLSPSVCESYRWLRTTHSRGSTNSWSAVV